MPTCSAVCAPEEGTAVQVLLRRGRLGPVRADHGAGGVLPDPHRAWHHGAACGGDGRAAGAALPAHRVWQWQQPQDPAPPRPVARPGRLRAHRRLGRAPAPLGPGAGRGVPGHRGAAAVRRLHAAAGPARVPEGCRPTGGLLPRLDARQLHAGGSARLAATDGGSVRTRRRTPARHRSAEGPARDRGRLQRPTGRHGRVQPQHPGADQSRTRRRLRHRAVRPPGLLQRRPGANRNAPRQPPRPGRSCWRRAVLLRRGRVDPHRELLQVQSPRPG